MAFLAWMLLEVDFIYYQLAVIFSIFAKEYSVDMSKARLHGQLERVDRFFYS